MDKQAFSEPLAYLNVFREWLSSKRDHQSARLLMVSHTRMHYFSDLVSFWHAHFLRAWSCTLFTRLVMHTFSTPYRDHSPRAWSCICSDIWRLIHFIEARGTVQTWIDAHSPSFWHACLERRLALHTLLPRRAPGSVHIPSSWQCSFFKCQSLPESLLFLL